MGKSFVTLLSVMLLAAGAAAGQPLASTDLPRIGAQVFIEPGQRPEQVDRWFRTLSERGMNLCRIRLFESYVRSDAGWDFGLFDRAFDAAERYGIKIYATLFPATSRTDIGGWKFPEDEACQAAFGEFIDAAVTHYRHHPALQGWVLINEPGVGELPRTPYVAAARTAWAERHPLRACSSEGYPVLVDLNEQRLLMHLNTEFLGWISERIRRVDPTHDIHVNTHAIFDNCAQYDLPRWRTFLTSLGGSAHAAWHFGLFDRDAYALAMLANAEIIRSGSGPLPWLMTELQGGNNTYSGRDALCPTPAEIAQWLWIVLATEGKGAIFWMLNSRHSGFEAGEWSMLDFQDRPTARLEAAAGVARAIGENASLIAGMKVIPSGVDVLYFRESLWTEKNLAVKEDPYAGRRDGAVMKSTLACFRALTECGLNVGLKEAAEYDFTQDDYTGRSIVLSDQLSVPASGRALLERFVSRGGTLFIEGMSLFFDEYVQLALGAESDYRDLLGESLSEYLLEGDLFRIPVEGRELPCHLWRGTFVNSRQAMHVHEYGRGKVVWLPSTVALGAWQSGDFAPLAGVLLEELAFDESSIRFDRHVPGVLMRTLAAGRERVLVCMNKSRREVTLHLKGVDKRAPATPIDRIGAASYRGGCLKLAPESVMVMRIGQ